MTQATYERRLSPAEIEERKNEALRTMRDIDANLADVATRRREIRTLNADRKKLELKSTQLRREADSGVVVETAQAELAIDTSVADPFNARYPMARDHQRLQGELAVVLQGVLVPSVEKLEQWHPNSGVFDAIAHWARVEIAYMNRRNHPDLPLPPRAPMPEKLAELRMYLGKQGAKRPRAAKVRPAGAPTKRPRARGAK